MAVSLDLGAMPTEKPRVVVYMDEQIKADLEKLAARDDRPVSNFVLQLIKREIAEAREKGILPAEQSANSD
ncbi:MAG TPA: hypothetical protein V6D29_23725 [Leptolyngbyaceae cyanobacterium]